MSADREPTRLMRPGQHAEAAATARSRGVYPRPEPGRMQEMDAIAADAKRRADRLRLAGLMLALVAFLVLVVATGVLR